MPDTTTTHLSLTLIEEGGSENTWGGKVNDNMSAIDAERYLEGIPDAVHASTEVVASNS